MPEWVTHVIVAFALAVVLGVRSKSIAVLGALLPDLVQKLAFPAAYLIGATYANAIFGIGHTPIFSLALSIVICSLLPGSFRDSLKAISLGWASHYALDVLQGPYGQQLLWPFSQQQFGLFLWYSDSPIPIAITLIALSAYAVWKTVVKKQKLF